MELSEILHTPGVIYSIAVIAALIPVYALHKFIRRKDAAHPEPRRLMWKGLLFGAFSVVLVLVGFAGVGSIEEVFPQFVGKPIQGVLDAFLMAAIPEESAKLFMLWLLLRKNKYFDERLDGIVYATCIGLGFAAVENVLYVTGDITNFAQIAISRACLSVPGHFFFAVGMGYFVSRAKFCSKTQAGKRVNLALALIFPIILHGIYDALLMVPGVDETLSGICFCSFIIFVILMQKFGRRHIDKLKEEDDVIRRKAMDKQ